MLGDVDSLVARARGSQRSHVRLGKGHSLFGWTDTLIDQACARIDAGQVDASHVIVAFAHRLDLTPPRALASVAGFHAMDRELRRALLARWRGQPVAPSRVQRASVSLGARLDACGGPAGRTSGDLRRAARQRGQLLTLLRLLTHAAGSLSPAVPEILWTDPGTEVGGSRAPWAARREAGRRPVPASPRIHKEG